MTAREAAVDLLHAARTRRVFASELLDDLDRDQLSGPDRRLVTQLVLGVIRRRATLDALLAPFVNRPMNSIEPRVLDCLHLGAYQLALLTQVPHHAAVHETVDLARYVGSPMAKGFLNGVLRRVAELVTDELIEMPAADALPMDDGRYRRLTKPVLPDPRGNPVGYLAAAFSWPLWLADRWFANHGFAECCRLGFHFNAPPPLWLRVNPRRTDRERYRLRLAAETIDAVPGEHPQSLRLTGGHVPDLPGYADGDFAVQDHASMLVASALAPQPGWRVLDLCAAPGGKTTHLAELMDNRGEIIACDIDAKRLETVASLATRMKHTIIETRLLNENDDAPAGPFDAALVDVPCSNTGVLGRRPEVRWRLQPREFEHLIQLQLRLLRAAIDRVKPGGVIVYSTCSIEPEENSSLIRGVCHLNRAIRFEAEQISIPGRPSDGGYWARLRRTL